MPGAIDPHYLVSRAHHRISKTHVSANALKVIARLHQAGFQAYLVGGGVRDLLLNKQPKDFDIATDATPNEVRKLFRNARIIGRRFKLVHVWFYRETIEVATFRASEPTDDNQKTNETGMLIRDNVYGNLFQDAWRRDFTINALYYEPESGSVVDIIGGMKDVQAGVLRIIGEPVVRYQEDPVRMLRAIRFAAKLHLTIDPHTAAPLLLWNKLIAEVSSSRLFDEVVKLYQCGEGRMAQQLLMQYGIFEYLFPTAHALSQSQYPLQALLNLALESTDARIKQEKTINPAFIFAIMLWFPLQEHMRQLQETGLSPLHALEQAMSIVINTQNRVVTIPKRFTQMMREIWVLQYRFSKRLGGRAQHLMTHPRFRAAYDMLALRALAQDAPQDLAAWWTRFQEVDEVQQIKMVGDIMPANKQKKKKKSTSS
ncbi:MAG: polynucleotide adenylyltransferase PcnB [Gammaproteobacteria bacterium]|nr:polynucleotide adenylyltransferase PcnB [Gammaproteobacteria bacterium]